LSVTTDTGARPRPSLTAGDMLAHYQIEQFLFYEAALLDARRFDEWFALLADDLEYWMPVRTTRALNDVANEFAKLGEGAFFDDDKISMGQRVKKFTTGFSWAEDPPSRTRHHVTNVRVIERRADEVVISCNFLVYRSRLANEVDVWSGRREDTLRGSEGNFTLVKRHLFLDDVSLNSKNLSSFL
jgi:3-phenylpropionate/cinnamic acid dioxygenase small subunit